MFNADFYPTPPEVIDYMLQDIDVYDKVCLEPSAGKGNIVDVLNKRGAKSVITFEKEPDLQLIVSQKSKLLGNDFLEARPEQLSHIHAIIMNPPFSAGGKHILKAWQAAPEGCQIVALCNSNTLDKDYSRERRELNRLILDYGKSENLGDCFATSERKTGVSVTLIRLFKPIKSKDYQWEGFFMEEDEEVITGPGIMPHNEVRSIVNRYIGAVQCFDEFTETSKKINAYLKPIGVSDGFSCTISSGKKVTTKEEFSKELQKRSWDWIFRKMKISKYVTAGVMSDVNKFVEQQQNYPFTMKNIYRMFEIIVGTRQQTMNRAVEEIFDKITTHYHDNRYHVEGWKTNSHYLIGQKFILPYMITKGWHGEIDANWSQENKMDDLNKVLCFLTGKNYDDMQSFYSRIRMKSCHLVVDGKIVTQEQRNIVYNQSSSYTSSGSPQEFTMQNALEYLELVPHTSYQIQQKAQWGKWAEWHFFDFKCYKKGTIHFKFKDLKVWELFNRTVAEIKGYPLPEKI